MPVMINPSYPAVLNAMPNGPPQEEATISPVSGDLLTPSKRAEQVAPLPNIRPIMKIKTFSGPSGSVPGRRRW